jgi:hypothetical protein
MAYRMYHNCRFMTLYAVMDNLRFGSGYKIENCEKDNDKHQPE